MIQISISGCEDVHPWLAFLPDARPHTVGWSDAGHVLTRIKIMLLLNTSNHRSVWDGEILGSLPALHRYAHSLARNLHAAEDLVQDTIVKAYAGIDRFEPGSNLRAWLFTILRNTFYSSLRKHRREVGDPDGKHAATLVAYPEHDGRIALKEFFHAFEKLSPEHRTIVAQVSVGGHSCRTASELSGIPVGTAKSRLSRARAQLSELLDR
jgi:RNA polymerase sigma-70 factor, ECF subfamily